MPGVRLAALCFAAAGALSCGDKKGTAPSSNAPSISGNVTDVVSGSAIAGASVAVHGKTATTNSEGRYTIGDLTAGSATVTATHQGHRNFSQNVSLSGASVTNIAMTPSTSAAMAGTWRGTTAGRTAFLMSVTVNTVAQTVQVTIDVRGRSDTFSAPYSATTEQTLTRTSAAFGNITVKIPPGGPITGTLTNHPAEPDIRRIDFTVTGSSTAINITHTISWAHGDVETETLRLTKQ